MGRLTGIDEARFRLYATRRMVGAQSDTYEASHDPSLINDLQQEWVLSIVVESMGLSQELSVGELCEALGWDAASFSEDAVVGHRPVLTALSMSSPMSYDLR